MLLRSQLLFVLFQQCSILLHEGIPVASGILGSKEFAKTDVITNSFKDI